MENQTRSIPNTIANTPDNNNQQIFTNKDFLISSNTNFNGNIDAEFLVDYEEGEENFFTKYGEMDIPKILLKDIDAFDSKPWNEPNQKISDYFNYNFKEETWKEYVQSLKIKYDEINNLILDKTIKNNFNFESYKDLETYLFNFPSDLGGLGETYNDQKYEDLNFFYYKPSGKIAELPQPEYKPNINASFINLELPIKSSNFNANNENKENENKKNPENAGTITTGNEPNLPHGMGNIQQAYMNQIAYMNYMRMMGNMAAAWKFQMNMANQEFQKSLMQQQNEEENERHSKHKREKKKKKKRERSRSRSRSSKKESDEEREKNKKKSSSHKDKNRDREKTSKRHKKRSRSESSDN